LPSHPRTTVPAAEVSRANTSGVLPPIAPSVDVNMPAGAATQGDHGDTILETIEQLTIAVEQYRQVRLLQHLTAFQNAQHVQTIDVLEQLAMEALMEGHPDITQSIIPKLYAIADQSSDVPHLSAAYTAATDAAGRLEQAVISWRAANEPAQSDAHP